MPKAFECFNVEALALDPQNAYALAHCGVSYKDEGHFRGLFLTSDTICSFFLFCNYFFVLLVCSIFFRVVGFLYFILKPNAFEYY